MIPPRDSAEDPGPSRAEGLTEPSAGPLESVETPAPTTTFREPQSAAETAAPLPSRIGRFVVQDFLGRGGFGAVYKAWDPELRRPVAIKVPRSGLLQTTAEIEAFLDEARRAVQLEHPGIVSVYDAGNDAGQCYIVCRYFEGQTLTQLLASRKLPIPEVARLIARLADAVHFAHRHGWVHRDIKPSNVLLDGEGNPHLADFGIAAKLDDMRRSEFGGAGTLPYMAPEIVRPLVARKRGESDTSAIRPDHRADIYSLGVVLYRLLTHRLPFENESPDALCDMILHSEAVPPRLIDEKIPARLEEICLRAMANDLASRYRTAGDLRDELQMFDPITSPSRQPVSDSPVPISPSAAKPAVPWTYACVGIGLILITVGLIAYPQLFNRRTAPTPVPPSAEPSTVEVVREVRALLRDQDNRRFRQREGLPDVVASSGESDESGTPSVKHNKKEPLSLPAPFAGPEAEIAEARDKGDEKKEFDLLLKTTNELIGAGYFEEAKAGAERMVELAGKDPGRVPFAYGQLGLAQYRLGQAELAIASYEESLKVYRSLYTKMAQFPDSPEVKGHLAHLARLIGISLMRIGNANKFLERYENAEAAYLKAKEILELHDRKSELMTLLSNLGSLQSLRGEHPAAIATLEQSLALAGETNDTKEESETLINLGNAQARSGDNAAAIESYKRAFDIMGASASYEARTGVLVNWVTTLVDEGRLDEAEEMLAQLRRTVRPNDHQSNRILRLLEPVLTKRPADPSGAEPKRH